MSPIFLLFSLAVVFHCSPANAQPVKWEPLTEQQEHDLKLEHGAHLLEVAAPFKSFITVDQTRPQQTVVVQEYVTVQFNCLSWLNRFERGTARWLIQHLFADQTPRTSAEYAVNRTRIRIHPLNHWLTVVGTIALEGASDPDYGRYTCEVCLPADDAEKQQCHRSTTTLFIVGSPPRIEKGMDNNLPYRTHTSTTGEQSEYYHIGTDICINRETAMKYILTCDIDRSVFPHPYPRTLWKKNKNVFFNSGQASIRNDFYAPRTGNEVFNPSEVNPPVLTIVYGRAPFGVSELMLSTVARNVSLLATTLDISLSTQLIRSHIVDALIGDWTCELSNEYGNASATTTFKDCGSNLTVSGRLGNMLGGAGVFIETTGQFHRDDTIVCQFGTDTVDAQRFGRSSAVCVSPAVDNTGSLLFLVLINDKVEKVQSFRSVSPEVSHAVALSHKQNTLLFTSGDRITLRWSPESLVPPNLVNNITVDISIQIQDYNDTTTPPVTEFTEVSVLDTSFNDGEVMVILDSYSLACSSTIKGVTFTVCPIYFKISVSKNQYLPSDLAIWSGTAYYRPNHVTDVDMVDQCDHWRANSAFHVRMLQIVQRQVRCPPTHVLAVLDQNFQVEIMTSSLTNDQSYQTIFQNYFHPGTKVCYRQNRPWRLGFGQQCCYGHDGILVKKPTGGSVDYTSPITNYHRHVLDDLVPYILCCKGDTFAKCDKYFEARPEGSEEGYFRRTPGFLFGDPHIVTLDGLRYTFNGKGEFILIQTDPQVFSLQGRMEQAVDSNGSPAPGTVFTAIVAKQHSSNTSIQFQVDTKSDSLSVLLNAEEVLFNNVAVLDFEDVILYNKGNKTVQALFTDEVSVEISVKNGIIALITVSLPKSMMNTTSGLMGTFNGFKSDDLKPRNKETSLSLDESQENIHNKFGITWIIKDSSESLFTYKAADSWSTFHFPGFVPMFHTTFTNSTLEREAKEKCNNNTFCLFDIAATERLEVGVATMEEEEKINTVEEISVPIVCNPTCQNGVCLKNNTCQCSDGFQGDRCTQAVIESCGQTNPCQNNGNCSVQALTFSCSCSPDFEGTLCQRKVPSLKIQMQNGSPKIRGSELTIEFKTSEPAWYLCILNSFLSIPCLNGVVRVRLGNGINSFSITAISNNGDYSTIFGRIYIGACSINLINNGVTISGRSAAIEFTGSDDIPRFQCVLDGTVTHTRCRSPLRYTGLRPGQHKLEIRPQGCKNASKDSTLPVNFEL